jgi:cephalosporin-C deacetylase-like acetyl esterase
MVPQTGSRRRPFATTLALAALVGLVAGCGGSGTMASPSSVRSGGPHASPPAGLLAYDATAPLDERVDRAMQPLADGIGLTGISWASPGGGRVSAWLVTPADGGRHAAIVYLHGSETDRNDLLDEAVAMAHGGAVGLVMDAPFARQGDSRRAHLQSYTKPELERDMTAQAGVDVRRAFDLLAARSDVDVARLGFVGHSWGASLGAVVASVDERPVAWALLSPRPSWTEFLRSSTDGFAKSARNRAGEAGWQRYLSLLAPFDALPVIGKLEGHELLLQYGTQDDVVPPSVAKQLTDAAPAGTTVQTLPAGHDLDADAIAARAAWLGKRLGLAEIPPAALAEVGLPDQRSLIAPYR